MLSHASSVAAPILKLHRRLRHTKWCYNDGGLLLLSKKFAAADDSGSVTTLQDL